MTCPSLAAASATLQLRCVLQPGRPRLPVRGGASPASTSRSPARLSFQGITCQNHSWGESRASTDKGSSTRDPNKRHTELLEGSRGSAGSGLRPRKRKKSWAGPCGALPDLGRSRKQPSACSYCLAGRRKQVPWNGFLLPPQLQRAWVSSSNGRPCWRPPFPGDSHCPWAGHFAICPAIAVRGPKALTWCW